jgi:DHA3 family macrolide efflux protein-like MFS transporter
MQTRSEALRFSVHTWWHDFMLGYRYIMARSGMRALMLFSAVVSFLWGMVGALIIPMLLGFASTGQLGVLLSIAGSGMLAGSIAMSVWGGPRRRMFGFEAVSGLCFVAVGVSTQLAFVAASVFVAHFTIAVVNGSSQALWQAKVPIHIQGRVFAVLQALTRSSAPLAFLLAGFLADNVFLPLLAPGGILVDVIGPLIGVGPGRGIGFMFLLMGIIKMVVVTIGCLYAPIRHLERSVPDVPPAEPVRVHP